MLNGPRTGVYPGTFDPITKGHVDVIRRASKVVDRLVVAVAVNIGKDPMFGLEERVALVRAEVEALAERDQLQGCEVDVRPFDNLLMHFAHDAGAQVVVRGLRAVSDFEYEFQMAAMNARLCPEIETMFLMASETNQFISSRFVKEISRLGGDVSSFVSRNVLEHLTRKRVAPGRRTAAS